MESLEKMNFFKNIFGFDISPYVTITEFQPEEFIIREGERPRYLYYLTEGRAKLFLSHENGKISLINFLEGSCFIGEMELLDEKRLPQGVKAISLCRCYQIEIAGCGEKLLQDAKFLRFLCTFLSEKATNNTNNYMRNQSYPLKPRFAEFILKMTVNGYYREPHTEVADFLGVTYRHLLYVLAGFVQEGILQKTNRGYFLADEKKLREYASAQNHTDLNH